MGSLPGSPNPAMIFRVRLWIKRRVTGRYSSGVVGPEPLQQFLDLVWPLFGEVLVLGGVLFDVEQPQVLVGFGRVRLYRGGRVRCGDPATVT